MIQTIFNIDEKFFLLLNSNHTLFLDYLMLFASNLLSNIPIILLIAFIATMHYKKQGNYHPKTTSIILTTVLILGIFFCFEALPTIFAQIFQRERPCVNPNISSFVRLLGEDCDPSNGSFAVRPCIMFFITSFLFFTIKEDFTKIKAFLILWSLLVSYSRIYLGAHYPLNVFFASLTGMFWGYFTSRMYLYLKYQIFSI